MHIDLRKVYAVWYREIKRTLNSKGRILGSLGMPLFMLLALGVGIGALVKDFNYQSFILPGIIGQVLLFNSIFAGVSVIWDRQFGFLKEMLVSPTSRRDIVLGRMLGGATNAVVQGMLVLFMGTLFGISPILQPINYIILLILMFFISSSFVGVGIAIASMIEEMETFQLIMNFIIMPIFFLSNALFPVEKLPTWLHSVVKLNPLTYAVDGFRYLIVSSSSFPFVTDLFACTVFLILSVGISAYLFDRTRI